LRAVLVPSEHGGWGLTLEPVLLGLLVAPAWPGAGLGLAAFIVFLARTPLKVLLVDAHRHRQLERTRVAGRVVAGYGVVLAACAAVVIARAPARCWIPLAGAAPLAGIGLWFDMRSRSRRLLPELAGAVGIAGVAAAVVLADGKSARIAVVCWLLLAGRAVTSITFVRDQVGALHGRPRRPKLVLAGDGAALAIAALAPVIDHAALAGAFAIVGLVLIERLLARRPPPRAVVLGLTQTVLGLMVVIITALGILWA
jgi:hypothetical protein